MFAKAGKRSTAFLCLQFSTEMNDRARHARADELTLRRLAELTKREIQVYLYLRLCRNAKTGKCNPSNSLIRAGTGIGLNGVWLAINGLVSKGWIVPDPTSGFEIVSIEQVPKLGSNPTPEGSQIRKRTGSQIENKGSQIENKGSQIGKLHNKDINLNRQRTDKEQLTVATQPPETGGDDRDKRAIWTEGVRMLTNGANMNEDAARRLLGKLAKQTTERTLAEAIGACMYENPADPRSFLVAAVKVREKSKQSATVGRSAYPVPTIVAADFTPRPSPDLSPETAAAWDRLKREIAARVPADVFDSWFARLMFDGNDGMTFKLRGDAITVDWVQRVYTPTIGEAMTAADLELFSIVWEVEECGSKQATA